MPGTNSQTLSRGHKRYRYDDEKKKQWQDQVHVLETAGLQAGMAFVDLGCGDGFFAVPAARMVGPRGCVYAYDINAQAIKGLKLAVAREGLDNLVAQVREGRTILFQAATYHILRYRPAQLRRSRTRFM